MEESNYKTSSRSMFEVSCQIMLGPVPVDGQIEAKQVDDVSKMSVRDEVNAMPIAVDYKGGR